MAHGVIGELETLLRFAGLAGQAESWGRKKCRRSIGWRQRLKPFGINSRLLYLCRAIIHLKNTRQIHYLRPPVTHVVKRYNLDWN